MRSLDETNLLRGQLELRLNKWQKLSDDPVPRRGWIREIRESLGMSAHNLGRRMNVTQSSVSAMEKSEAAGTLRIAKLRAAANAMNCRLVYALVPNKGTLSDIIKRQAQIVSTFPVMLSLKQARMDAPMPLVNALIQQEAEKLDRKKIWVKDEEDIESVIQRLQSLLASNQAPSRDEA